MKIKTNNHDITISYQPFIKWAGGKRRLFDQLLSYFPKNFNNYYEPFLGGGAVFFELYARGMLDNKKVFLSDINAELINSFNMVKNNPYEIITKLKYFKANHSKDFYYDIRDKDRQENFKTLDKLSKAARFIYLNKTCFNGLYRVNKKGCFNTPIGSYKNPNIVDEHTILNASKALQNAAIEHKSFDSVLNLAKKGDLVYFDPPYYPLNETANFTSYDAHCFLKDEQIKLFEVFEKLSANGVEVAHSNSDTEFINKLYKKYNINIVRANRFVNSKVNCRGKINEVLVRNIKMCFDDLKNTLKDSIFTWNYFTDFEKAKANVKNMEVELNILNYLIGRNNIEDEFIQLIEKYPNIRKALPLLIAVRKNKLYETPIISDISTLVPENKQFIFYDDLSTLIKKELLIFFNESGLKEIFENKLVKNLVDYCFGVEVGFDTNARKNRTGKLMENIVSRYLENFCSKNQAFQFIAQATQERIEECFNCGIKIDKNSRRFDFALYNQILNKLYLIEVNYYGGGGSKLKATAGEYQYLNDFLKDQSLDFIWITDGQGWLSAINSLEETFNHNDHVVNLHMIENGILNKICLNQRS